MNKRPFACSSRAPASARAQRGATLFIGLIMVVLITLIVSNAFTLSSSNLQAVTNMQMRAQATAAANRAIEQLITDTTFKAAPVARTVDVDINNDGTNDYSVVIAAPVCMRSVKATNEINDLLLKDALPASAWNTEWDIDATVTDAISGALVRVRQGIRVRMTNVERVTACP